MGILRDLPEIDGLKSETIFQVADAACFLWKTMDDAHIIYDKRSGHSQALNDFAREIFDIIGDKPRCLADILAELQAILGEPPGAVMIEQVESTIAEFDKMGLIEPVKLI